MRYPEFLKEGGTIGFIAPSFGEATEPYASRFDNALKIFKEAGYKTVEGPNCRRSEGIGKSNSPEKCAEEINDFIINNRSDIVMSVGGGELRCEDIPFVDFEAIKKAKPKWFIGYSDNTNLSFLLPTLCDTAAIYGPCVTDFGMRKWHPA
ncbi:MAG: LD-carboxypeptidase, partial [Lachnospiraceae bacterium]|nr:LD-carboxypeptidase [Lachnospiraceae bacterium]